MASFCRRCLEQGDFVSQAAAGSSPQWPCKAAKLCGPGKLSYVPGQVLAGVGPGRSSPLPTLGSPARTSRSPCSAHT